MKYPIRTRQRLAGGSIQIINYLNSRMLIIYARGTSVCPPDVTICGIESHSIPGADWARISVDIWMLTVPVRAGLTSDDFIQVII